MSRPALACILPRMQNSSNPLIYLASASPRRSALLTQIGVAHRVAAGRRRREHRDAARSRRSTCAGSRCSRPRRCGSSLPLAERGRCSARTRRSSWTTRSWASPSTKRTACGCCGCCRVARTRSITAVALRASDGCSRALSVSDVTFPQLTTTRCGATGAPASPPTRPAATPCRDAPRCSSSASPGSYSGIMGLPLFETGELLRDRLAIDTAQARVAGRAHG